MPGRLSADRFPVVRPSLLPRFLLISHSPLAERSGASRGDTRFDSLLLSCQTRHRAKTAWRSYSFIDNASPRDRGNVFAIKMREIVLWHRENIRMCGCVRVQIRARSNGIDALSLRLVNGTSAEMKTASHVLAAAILAKSVWRK